MGASAVSCRMKEIEAVRTVKLVYIGRLLRMGSDYFVGDGFTGKGE